MCTEAASGHRHHKWQKHQHTHTYIHNPERRMRMRKVFAFAPDAFCSSTIYGLFYRALYTNSLALFYMLLHYIDIISFISLFSECIVNELIEISLENTIFLD